QLRIPVERITVGTTATGVQVHDVAGRADQAELLALEYLQISVEFVQVSGDLAGREHLVRACTADEMEPAGRAGVSAGRAARRNLPARAEHVGLPAGRVPRCPGETDAVAAPVLARPAGVGVELAPRYSTGKPS